MVAAASFAKPKHVGAIVSTATATGEAHPLAIAVFFINGVSGPFWWRPITVVFNFMQHVGWALSSNCQHRPSTIKEFS
jgi:hypothetical protein